MRKMGCRYETATNGLAALEKYKECAGQFDYVLMGTNSSTLKHRQAYTDNNRYLHAHHGWNSILEQDPGV